MRSYFSVAISWGNKTKFSVCVRTWLVFAQTVTYRSSLLPITMYSYGT